MNKETCLKKLGYVGVLAFATVDENNKPQVRNISAIHFENEKIYFFTARGKNFCRELLSNENVQILGYTKYKEMIRVSGKAIPLSDKEQKKYIDIIFSKQPYLYNVYPDNTNEIGIIFVIENMEIEYFNLGVNPIFRECYTTGKAEITEKGYYISDLCISCSKCVKNCPQRCIEQGEPYKIQQEHCLHCGNCFEKCPVNAVIRKE